MPPWAVVPGRRARNALAAVLLLLAASLAGSAPAVASTVSASVSGTPVGPALPSGYLGTSFEYRAVRQYTGGNAGAIDPVLVALLRGLDPGQGPILRIGGNSTDATWWPTRHVIPGGGISYGLNTSWLKTTRALAAAVGGKLILGINLKADKPAIAAAEGREFQKGIGRRYIQALEIGNEPDLYNVFPYYLNHRGRPVRARGRHYGLPDYTHEFTRWRHVLPGLPLAGPAASGPAWMGQLGRFISTEPSLKLVTYHRYPLRSCGVAPAGTNYPSIANLLADRSSSGLAAGVTGFVKVAHAHRRPLRLTELNSSSCEGTAGVSDTFASALWALDTLFHLAAVGVDGVNFHMLPGSHYELFSPSRAGGQWQAAVHPEYYGLLMFAQAFPRGARLLRVGAPSGPLKVWATQDSNGTSRVTLINKDPANARNVQIRMPGTPGPGTLETLQAPSVSSTSEVTLGGQTFGPETSTGRLSGPPQTTTVTPLVNTFSVQLPAGSAALLTVPSSGGGSALIRRAAPQTPVLWSSR
jgi:hypothetical protein